MIFYRQCRYLFHLLAPIGFLCVIVVFGFEILLPKTDEVSAIVIDLGSHTCKVGYACEDAPKAIFPSVSASVTLVHLHCYLVVHGSVILFFEFVLIVIKSSCYCIWIFCAILLCKYVLGQLP